jgi:hypothetical protein
LLAEFDGGHSPEVEELAGALAGREAGAIRYEYARQIAAAQSAILDLRRARTQLLAEASACKAIIADRKYLRQLGALYRYEKRALARRRRAIRRFTTNGGIVK